MFGSSPIFFSAILLTGVNLLLRFAGTSFQVYISNQIGPSGVGLLQLVMSVGSLAMIAGMAGIRTGTMYLTAEELGKNRHQSVPWVLSGCFRYSIFCSGLVAALLYSFSPIISEYWIGDTRTVNGLKLYAAFLPVTCLCGVMTGLFTAAGRIKTLAAVEVVEQFFSMAVTIFALNYRAGSDPARACECVIWGSCAGSCITLVGLSLLQIRTGKKAGPHISIQRRLLHAAVPLALADIFKAGINTTENLMVPKRLRLNGTMENPLAAFGIVTGMVFPIMMFPSCILYGLAELLIPELARCAAADSKKRISYLVQRSLKVAMVYGLLFSGMIYLTAEELCIRLYNEPHAGTQLRLYALLIPMLYCDAITDAMTKGLGQQKICVRYNIITSALDVLFLYFLLPKYAMTGYFISFSVTHLINFLLSLNRLLKITGERIPFYIPVFSICACAASAAVTNSLQSPVLRICAFVPMLLSMLYLLRVLSREDLQWMKGLVFSAAKTA